MEYYKLNRRELLFRGQTRRKGERVWMNGKPVPSNWVYGSGVFLGTGDKSIIYGNSKHVVYTDTICQYTGYSDKNDQKIFEGDILDLGASGRLMDVRWNQESGGWELTDIGVPNCEVNHLYNTIDLGEIQVEAAYGEMRTVVVGNIFDDPVPIISGDSRQCCLTLCEMAQEEDDASLLPDVTEGYEALEKEMEEQRILYQSEF